MGRIRWRPGIEVAGAMAVALVVGGGLYAARVSPSSSSLSPAAAAASAQPSAAQPSGAQPPASQAPVHYRGSFTLDPAAGSAGTAVTASGSGFEPGESLTVSWNTVRGRWVLKGASLESFGGRAFDPVLRPIAAVQVDAGGAFHASFIAPDDFGFSHDVTVTSGGTIVNKAAFRIEPLVTVTPASGPAGTPITIRMQGVGWQDMENSWLVSYDDEFTGWLSSVTTGGTAVATIPATGTRGTHVIRIVHGSMTVPYLNMEQSPRPDRPTFTRTFALTAGDPVLPPDSAGQALAPLAGSSPAGTGQRIWTDPASATVGTPVTVHGAGLEAGASVDLQWWTVIGSRVSGNGWDERSTTLGNVTVAGDGTFAYGMTVPDDLGGAHRIEAVEAGNVVARGSLVITPSAYPLSVSSGPAGTMFTIHLKGVGWTETANIYTVDYDNGYLGYACGFNSGGDVVIHLPAAGTPGWHFVDLYPAIYKGTDNPGTNNFRIPQLTYLDHPGEHLPAFHFAFLVTH